MELSKIGRKASNSDFRQLQNVGAIREVFGTIIQDTTLLSSYPLQQNDFVELFHQTVFAVIHNLARDGVRFIEPEMIEDYLKDKYPAKYNMYVRHNGNKYLYTAIQLANKENLKLNFDEIKKWSLLRQLLDDGFDISYYYDPNCMDENEQEEKSDRFNNSSVDEMLAYFKNKLFSISKNFYSAKNRESVKAGGAEALAQKNKWKDSIDFGLTYSSNYLTTITNGIRRKRFTVTSAGTGVGKTRFTVANICHSFAPKFYDTNTKQWLDNPNGTQNSALYIGTEMELREEVEPIIWAYMANVPEDHITMNSYAPGEEERVEQAIEYLRPTDKYGREKNCGIYLEYVPEYDITTLESIIEEHVTLHNISAVFFDYIHTTAALQSEHTSKVGRTMTVREDQILSNLSNTLKNLSRKYNISIDSWTQVSGEYKNIDNRDQSIVRGAKSIIDKVDIGAIMSTPTDKEIKKLEAILRSGAQLNRPLPNICYSVYKNRGGRYNNIKVWLYFDKSTVRVHDLFCTDYDYKILNINKSYVTIDEDEQVKVFTSVDEMNKYNNKSDSDIFLDKDIEENYEDSYEDNCDDFYDLDDMVIEEVVVKESKKSKETKKTKKVIEEPDNDEEWTEEELYNYDD